MPGRRRRRGAQRGARRLSESAGDTAPDAGDELARASRAPGARLHAVWRLLLYVAALVAAFAVTSALRELVLGPLAVDATATLVASSWLMLAAAAIAHVLMLRVVERRPWADVGLGGAQARPRGLVAGALLGALAVGVPTLALLAAGWLRVDPAPAAGVAGWVRSAGAMLAFMAPAALFEELVFRGYPFMVLRERAGTAVAIGVTSALFGLVHWQNPGASVGALALVTLAGVFLGAVLLATGSLWAAWTAHLAWNWTLGAVLHAAVSGLPFATPGYQVVDAGPDWLTGGAWGPEGGAGAAAGLLGALALLLARRAGGAPAGRSDTLHARPERRGGS